MARCVGLPPDLATGSSSPHGGQFSLAGTTTTSESNSTRSPFEGTLTVEADGSIRGSCADGPIVDGLLSGTRLTFDVLYNASILFRYEMTLCDSEGVATGTWSLVDSPNAALPHNHGKHILTAR